MLQTWGGHQHPQAGPLLEQLQALISTVNTTLSLHEHYLSALNSEVDRRQLELALAFHGLYPGAPMPAQARAHLDRARGPAASAGPSTAGARDDHGPALGASEVLDSHSI